MNYFLLLIIILAVFLFLVCILWLFLNHGVDKLKHPEEWKNTGSSGERILYNTLVKNFHIPKNQIFRNVYIPTKNGGTSEIDLLVVSKKGFFVFECKNYGGHIYGDAKHQKWVQYIGRQKNYFYNPLFQNKSHAKHLGDFLDNNGIEVPITPLLSTISRGKWKIKNLSKSDYVLGLNCHFDNIYAKLPDSKNVIKNFNRILNLLAPLSRPDEKIQKTHVEQLKR